MELRLPKESELKFKDIRSEEYREYDFGWPKVVRITNPVAVHVSESGGHRVLDGDGVSHYIPTGWFHLHWKTKSGCPHFDF